jgi:hypothetical protein
MPPVNTLIKASLARRDVVAKNLGKLVASTFAVTGSATRWMTSLWSSTDLAVRKVGRSAARVPLVIWAGAAATVVVVALILGVTAGVREYAKRIDSTANAVARYGEHSDTEFATISAALREAAANRQQLESLIQANAQLVRQIADLKGQIDALKLARAAPRAARGRSKRRR